MGHLSEKIINVFFETHINKSIGFIKNNSSTVFKRNKLFLLKVFKSSRSGREDMNPFFNLIQLRLSVTDGPRDKILIHPYSLN